MDGLPRPEAVALDWLAEGRRVAAATLVEALDSAPLDPGAQMLVDDIGRIEGSVTGGCVEGALVEHAMEVLAGGPPRLVTYGISDAEAADVGLTCGGTVRLLVHELSAAHEDALSAVRDAIEAGEPVALATILEGAHRGDMLAIFEDRVIGAFGGPELLAHSVTRDARGLLDGGQTAVRRYSGRGEVLGSDLGVFIQAFSTPPSMVICGAIDFSAALSRLASQAGYSVTICDPRSAFVRSPRFASSAAVVVDWPDRHLSRRELGPRDAVLVFTHDPKLDEPALIAALASGAGYIGALGSRRTHADRLKRLRAAGVEQGEIDRIKSPCGLDIGARTPVETAISVLAEVLAVRVGRMGGPLTEADQPIHPRPSASV